MSKRERTFQRAKKDSEVMLVQIKEWGFKLEELSGNFAIDFTGQGFSSLPPYHLGMLILHLLFKLTFP